MTVRFAAFLVVLALVPALVHTGRSRTRVEAFDANLVAADEVVPGSPLADPAVEIKCGGGLPAGTARGATALRTTTSGGMVREYRVHVPTQAGPSGRFAVVLNFHGRYSDAATQESYSGLIPVSDREAFLLVTPEGTGSPRAWSAGATPPSGIDDVRFVADLLDAVDRDFCIDTTRVYATGLSNGAFLVSKLACLLGGRLAAVAVVSGVEYPSEPCGPPVPTLAFHGTSDELVPFNGGRIRGVYVYGGARKAMAQWALHNGCQGSAKSDRLAAHVVREAYTSCAAPVALIAVEGCGHTWPGASDAPALGHTTREISAAELIWQFFADKQLSVTALDIP